MQLHAYFTYYLLHTIIYFKTLRRCYIYQSHYPTKRLLQALPNSLFPFGVYFQQHNLVLITHGKPHTRFSEYCGVGGVVARSWRTTLLHICLPT